MNSFPHCLAYVRWRVVFLAVPLVLEHCLWGQQTTAPPISEYEIPGAHSAPVLITSGPDGNLWFINDQIGKITPTGTITQYPLPVVGAPVASYMGAGADGKVWFTEFASGKIASVTSAGAVTEYQLPGGQSASGITLGPDGNIWFTEDRYDHVGKIDNTGAITEFTIGAGSHGPHGITAGPDGNLWFTESYVGRIVRITKSGVLTEYSLTTPNSRPECITLGPDGNLWFTELRGAIGRITPNGTIAEYPASLSQNGMITKGPDGALWFPEISNNIGRITVTGAISEYPIPTPNSYPYGIAAGADGNIWFTEYSTKKIGKIVLSNPLPTGPVTVSESSLVFAANYLSAPPPSQMFTVSAPEPTSFSAALDGDYFVANIPWLRITPSGPLSTDQTIAVEANQGILLPGAHSGSISIVAGGMTKKVQVTLNVLPTTGGDVFTNVTSVHAFCTIGSFDPCWTELDIISKNSSIQKNPFVISVTTPAGGNWLSIRSADGAVIPSGSTEITDCAVQVTVDSKGLAPGAYTGVVTITPNNGAVVNIPVSATVGAAGTPAPIVQKVVNSASFAAGGASPGEIISIYGTGLGPTAPLGAALDSSGKVSTSLGGVLVSINGTLAPLIYVSPAQINCVVPYEAGETTPVNLQVAFLGIGSDSFQLAGANTAPGVFTLNGSGSGAGAILNDVGGVNGPNNPAAQGSTVTIFLTGEGKTNPPSVTGAITAINTSSSGPLTPQPLSTPVVTIGAMPAVVSFYGEAPGMVSGVLQINAVVPTGLHSGDLPLNVSIGGASSQPGLTVSVR